MTDWPEREAEVGTFFHHNGPRIPPFTRRDDTPKTQCGCPYGFPCHHPSTGEDRLCDICRREHDPDRVGIFRE